jgi:DNA-directed RNA polymerase specialized sigma24 family protein
MAGKTQIRNICGKPRPLFPPSVGKPSCRLPRALLSSIKRTSRAVWIQESWDSTISATFLGIDESAHRRVISCSTFLRTARENSMIDDNDRERQESLTAEEWINSPRLKQIVQYVARRTGVPAVDRDDLLQETAFVLWRARTTARLNSKYIHQVVRHRAIDLFFRVRKAQPFTMRSPPGAELLYLLRARISCMPVRQQRVCRMLFLEGLSEREAANRLRISRGAVQRLERQVLRILRGRYRVSGQRSAVSGQRSAVSGQRSAVSGQRSRTSF